MKVERIENEAEVVSILSLDDPRLQKQVLDNLECTKAEWVQGIVSMMKLNNGNFLRVYASKEKGKIKAYMIAVNAIMPPLSRYFTIVYQNFFDMENDNGELIGREALDMVIDWAKSEGAKKIVIQTEYPRIMSQFEFKPEKGTPMVLDL